MTNSIIAATVSARFLSTAVNFLINKFWSFESQQNGTRQVILFTFLFLGKMGASAALVSFLAFLPVPAVTLKIIVDTLLFFVSFIIQKHFIFKNTKKEAMQAATVLSALATLGTSTQSCAPVLASPCFQHGLVWSLQIP